MKILLVNGHRQEGGSPCLSLAQVRLHTDDDNIQLYSDWNVCWSGIFPTGETKLLLIETAVRSWEAHSFKKLQNWKPGV